MPNIGALAAQGVLLAKQSPCEANTPEGLSPFFSKASEEQAWHPLPPVVTSALAALPLDKRKTVLMTWLSWLSKRKTATENALAAIGLKSSLPSGLSDQSLPAWPIYSKRRVGDPRLRLLAGHSDTNVNCEPNGTDNAILAIANPDFVDTSLSPQSATDLMLQIRCLADVYARWEVAAHVVNTMTSDPKRKTQLSPLSKQQLMARALTVFRIEGDCLIIPEFDTLETSNEHAVALPPGRSRLRPNLGRFPIYAYCGTYLVDQNSLSSYWSQFFPNCPVDPVAHADIDFSLIMCGFDILWRTDYQDEAETILPFNPPFTPKDWTSWPAYNRQIMYGASEDIENAWRGRRSLLQCKPPAGTPGATFRVSAGNGYVWTGNGYTGYTGASAEYGAKMLSEAMMYLDRLTHGPVRFGAGAKTPLPEPIVYLLYHMGGLAPAMLAGAADAALQPTSTSPAATKLAAAMRSHGLTPSIRAMLPAIYMTGNKKSAQTEGPRLSDPELTTLKQKWPPVAAILGHPEVIELLSTYIVTTPRTADINTSEWRGWAGKQDRQGWFEKASPRANVIGYAQLYDYLLSQVSL